jgi:hypothetical protein
MFKYFVKEPAHEVLAHEHGPASLGKVWQPITHDAASEHQAKAEERQPSWILLTDRYYIIPAT